VAGSEWVDPARALRYLGRADSMPHRTEGEEALQELVPPDAARVLDLGTGDGRLLALVLERRPRTEGVALDFSPTMLAAARERFATCRAVNVIEHDLEHRLPNLGAFTAVVTSFAIHHLEHERKRSLYAEILDQLSPGGVFANLEHVSSPSPALHRAYLQWMGFTPQDEDPSNRLLDLETQLGWLRELGYSDVDCLWKWREFALLTGTRPPEEP